MESMMKMFDVQGVEIKAFPETVFAFLREAGNLPQWARAFVSAGAGRARLETPAGEVDVKNSPAEAMHFILERFAADQVHRSNRPRSSSVDFARRLVSAIDAGEALPSDTYLGGN